MLTPNISRVSSVQKMCKCNYTVQHLKDIFLKSIDAVLPRNLIKNQVKFQQRSLVVGGKSFSIRKPCYMVGFGKAVLEMALETEKVLGCQLKRGVVTVPVGIFETHKRPKKSKIEFIEGAVNNLPDKDAMKGANLIKDLAEGLNEDDLLIVLISGKTHFKCLINILLW